MDIEAQIRDIISEREPYLYEVLHENRNIRFFRGPLTEEKLWIPCDDATSLDTPRSTRRPKNSTDEGSIYTIGKSSLNTHVPDTKRHGRKNKRYLPTNVEQQKERDYIQRHLREAPPGIKNKIIEHFYQAPKVPFLGYGMPRPETKTGSVKNFQALSKPSGVVVVSDHRYLGGVKTCPHHKGTKKEYCDILGPGSCSACIEETNKGISLEIQDRLFPRISLSQDCLVTPRLSRTLRQGHMKQVRKKKLSELCISDKTITTMPKREEAPLSEDIYPSTRNQKMFALPGIV